MEHQVEDFADVGVGHFAGELDLPFEVRYAAGVAGDLREQSFQCDALVKLQIIGCIDLSHAAPVDKTEDAISLGHDLARFEDGRTAAVITKHPFIGNHGEVWRIIP